LNDSPRERIEYSFRVLQVQRVEQHFGGGDIEGERHVMHVADAYQTLDMRLVPVAISAKRDNKLRRRAASSIKSSFLLSCAMRASIF